MLLLLACHGLGAHAAEIARPQAGEFVRDQAQLLTPAERGALQQRCDQLLTDMAVPVHLLTLDSLGPDVADDVDLDEWAQRLLTSWQPTHPLMTGPDWSRGVLLLVVMDRQQVHLQFGSSWAGAQQGLAGTLVATHVIPAFRRGRYAQGLESGVAAVDAVIRGESLPSPPRDPGLVVGWSLLTLLALAGVVSAFHRPTARLAGRMVGGGLRSMPRAMDSPRPRQPVLADKAAAATCVDPFAAQLTGTAGSW